MSTIRVYARGIVPNSFLSEPVHQWRGPIESYSARTHEHAPANHEVPSEQRLVDRQDGCQDSAGQCYLARTPRQCPRKRSNGICKNYRPRFFATAARMSFSLTAPVLSRIVFRVVFGPKPSMGFGRFLFIVLPCFWSIFPSLSRWRPSSPGCFMFALHLILTWELQDDPVPPSKCLGSEAAAGGSKRF
jgi:hypothetical protein